MDALLFSGGLDSTIIWHLLDRPRRVYVKIGAPYEARELASLDRRFGTDEIDVVDAGSWLGEMADQMGHVPYRNLFFAVVAAAYTGADRVILGATAGETSGDKTSTFATSLSRTLSIAEARDVKLAMPFRHKTKRQLVALLVEKYGMRRAEPIVRMSPSCYKRELAPGYIGCGECMSCVRRWVACELNGIHEAYEASPRVASVIHDPRTSELWKFLRRTPVRDWWGVARLNMELMDVLHNSSDLL